MNSPTDLLEAYDKQKESLERLARLFDEQTLVVDQQRVLIESFEDRTAAFEKKIEALRGRMAVLEKPVDLKRGSFLKTLTLAAIVSLAVAAVVASIAAKRELSGLNVANLVSRTDLPEAGVEAGFVSFGVPVKLKSTHQVKGEARLLTFHEDNNAVSAYKPDPSSAIWFTNWTLERE